MTRMDQEPLLGGTPARTVVADDHPLVREAIRQILDAQPFLKVVGEAADGQEAIELCRCLHPQLVLMDVQMPRTDGIAATRAIKQELPDTAILIITSFEDPDYLFEAIKAGAAGYILKVMTPRELISAVRSVLSGESSLSPELSALLLRRLVREKQERPQEGATILRRPPAEVPGPPLVAPLAPREREVLQLVVWGQTNNEISRNLLISTSTVKKHLHRVLRKLGVSDRTQAAVRAVELGFFKEERERN